MHYLIRLIILGMITLIMKKQYYDDEENDITTQHILTFKPQKCYLQINNYYLRGHIFNMELMKPFT